MTISLGASAAFAAACGSETFTGADDAGAGDSGSSDANALDGAAVDGAADASSGPFCTALTPPPYFCADFDEEVFQNAYASGSEQALFTGDVVTDGGTLQAMSGGESPPNTLLSGLPALGAAQTGSAIANAPLAATGMRTHYRLDLDFRIDVLGATGSTQAVDFFSLRLYYAGGPANVYYRVVTVDGHLSFGIGDTAFTYTELGALPPLKSWAHATIDVDFSANRVAVTVAGLPTYTTSSGAALTYDSPTVSLGVLSQGSSDPMKVSFDNVTLAVDDGTDGG